MRISLTTSGGFSGRGVGSVTIEGTTAVVDGQLTTALTAEEEARLHRLPIVRTGRPAPVTPDAVTYTLVVDGSRFSWTDATAPRDCVRWAETLLKIRERALHSGGSSGDQTSSSM